MCGLIWCGVGTFDEGRLSLELTLAARMGLAALLGFLIGLERESRGKSAGERTFAIVALGAAAFSSTAITMFPDTAGQAVAGVATGIGFLGVGIIWRAEEGETRGVTTAASILCVAAIGVATGIGLYLAAVLATVLGSSSSSSIGRPHCEDCTGGSRDGRTRTTEASDPRVRGLGRTRRRASAS